MHICLPILLKPTSLFTIYNNLPYPVWLSLPLSRFAWESSKWIYYHSHEDNTYSKTLCGLWRERELLHTSIAYLSFLQHKSLQIECSSLDVAVIFSSFDIGISFEDPEVVSSKSLGMNRPQTYKRSSFSVGCMRGTFVCDNFLSPLSAMREGIIVCDDTLFIFGRISSLLEEFTLSFRFFFK